MHVGRLGVEFGATEDPLEVWLLERGDRPADAAPGSPVEPSTAFAASTRARSTPPRRWCSRARRALLVAQERAPFAPGDEHLPRAHVLLETRVGAVLKADPDLALAADLVEELDLEPGLAVVRLSR